MIVKTWGTRGSTPVSGPGMVKYGGNTTCVEITSRCLPANVSLCVDGGTGMVPYGKEVMRKNRMMRESGKTPLIQEVVCLLTHYHWDHIQGIPLAPITYSKDVIINFFGHDDVPKDEVMKQGPKAMLQTLLQAPYFPVAFHEIGSHLKTFSLHSPQESVIVFHPTGGKTVVNVDDFERMEKEEWTVPFDAFIGGSKGSFPVNECLVVRMYKSNHPEYTISYRFEERPTGKVFVFLTDHEVTASFPSALLRHVRGANLLIEDAQYLEDVYQAVTAGFGHGTGPYCVKLAKSAGGVTQLGLTHHDPNASDADVESILAEALEEAEPSDFIERSQAVASSREDADELKRFLPITIFACEDYQQISV